MINLFQPVTGAPELNAIGGVFASNWLGEGDRVREFERTFGEAIACPPEELLAISSCTEGLFHSVAALGLGPGDDVVMPTVSFVGAAHAVRASGARVVLADVDAQTLNPSAQGIERALTPATRAVLVLHYGGDPGEVERIAELARDRGVALIEDAAVGLGSQAAGCACGTLGDIGLWSFDSMKVITTGDGGMVRCSDRAMAERLRRSVKLGLGPSGFGIRRFSDRWWEIDPQVAGRRATMNSVAAAIGMAQLERLPAFLRRRAEIAAAYDAGLANLRWLRVRRRHDGSARTFYWVQTPPGARDRLAAHLLERGIYSTFKYWPLHRMAMYGSAGEFPGADRAASSTLLLPLHQGLRDEEVERVIEAMLAFRPTCLSR